MKRPFRLPCDGLASESVCFHPSSLCLFVESLEEDLGFLFKDQSLQTANEYAQSAQIAHEQDHLLRILSTSYGYIRHVVDCCLTWFLLESASDGLKQGVKTIFPLLNSFSKDAQDIPLPYKISQVELIKLRDNYHYRYLMHYIGFEEFVRSLDGFEPKVDSEMAVWGAQLLQGFLCENPSHRTRIYDQKPGSEFISIFYNPLHSSCPYFEGKRLGAFHLLETLGFLMEVLVGGVAKIDPESWDEMVSDPLYGMTFKIFRDYLFQNKPYYGRGLPIEWEAALELSLWIPISPFGFIGSYQIEWRDIHPGWRYIKIIEYLAQCKEKWTEPSTLDFESFDKSITEIQNRMCQALGWPMVSEIIASWQRISEIHYSEIHIPFLFGDHPRRRFLSSMMSLRNSFPFTAYINKEASFVTESAPSFPGIIANDKDIPLESSTWKNSSGKMLNMAEFHIFKGIQGLAHGFDKYYEIQDRHSEDMLRILNSISRSRNYNLEKHISQYLSDHFDVNDTLT